VIDVTFVTFSGDKKCHASHLSHFWEVTHEFVFELVTFFVTSFPKNVTFWPRQYKTFLNGKKCDDWAGTFHKREVGRPFGLRPTLSNTVYYFHIDSQFVIKSGEEYLCHTTSDDTFSQMITYMYIHTYVYICMYIHMYIYTFACTGIYIHLHVL